MKGILGAIGWGRDDLVRRVALFVAGEDVIEVEMVDFQETILTLLRKEVVVRGMLTEREGEMKLLRPRELARVDDTI